MMSEYWRSFLVLGILAQIWAFICILLEYKLAGKVSSWSQYVIMLFVIGYPNCQAIFTGMCSRMSNGVRNRALSASFFNITIQLSGLIGGNIYQQDDAPLYHRGNKILLGFAAFNIVFFSLSKLYYQFRNKKRDKIWNTMTIDQKIEYLNTTTEEANKRLDFRFEA